MEEKETKTAKETKIKINIPIDELNKGDKFVPVGINGEFTIIKPGEDVEVSKVVYDILHEAKYI